MPQFDDRFNFHPATTEDVKQQHEQVRTQTKTIARAFDALLPEGREKSLAITKLEEAMFWANAAIARNN